MAKRVARADTFFRRLRGLMLSRTFPADIDALVLSPCNAVHTFFMRYSLDVIFLDSKMKVVHIIWGMKPGKVSPVIKDAHYVVEMAAGSAASSGVCVGDLLVLD
ncbi:DUF192 domain-containing protein [Dethiobacter alkaliphilus]|uniref:DUF192 domain-containing protein n=1 Tax=Dethiobacter alkaliphilus TaxID=427926 RepID=UPI002225E71E|nr:DUF192 domain-containing protein [Dethiobacter alkaliphilus]MCW3489635.1 DUF192 domain-containing protein [Dethiobacter alkaliphilus]